MTQRFLGRDLDVGFIADEEGRVQAGPYSQLDFQAILQESRFPRHTDLQVVEGKQNLIQSLILRLKTERGELAPLGHPHYGSRHHRLIGEPNTEQNRNLLKLYLLECLRKEPRLDSIQQIEVRQAQGRENRDKVDVRISVIAKGIPDPLSLVVPFSFGEVIA